PLLSRIAPDLELTGNISTDLHLHSGVQPNAAGVTGLAGDCRLATRDLQVAWPSRLGDDRPALKAGALHVKFAAEAAGCRGAQLGRGWGVCRLEGGGFIPAGVEGHDEIELPHANFALRGELDLVALLRMLPGTVPMREGGELTDGTLRFELKSLAQDERTGWT